MHVIAAGPGTGKTTLAKAFAVGLERVSNSKPYPLGSVLVVHHIATAEEAFRELFALLPGRVAVFTSAHDAAHEVSQQSYKWRFMIEELEHFPIIVTTHEFYTGIRGERAKFFTKNGLTLPRAMTFIDEMAKEIQVHDVDPLALEGVWRSMQQDQYGATPELLKGMAALVAFTDDKRFGEQAIETPFDDRDGWNGAVERTQALCTSDASRYARSCAARNPKLKFNAVFGFAAAMADNRAFVARKNKGLNGVNFVGYQRALPHHHGMVLLDATADIDGVSKLSGWRKHADVPTERYDHLEIIHVPSVASGTVRRWLQKPQHMSAYVEQIIDILKRHVAPGEKALVVCIKDVIEARGIPNWSDHVKQFAEGDTKDFKWDLEGRQIALTWYGGYGIGANVWRDASVVLLVDDFHLPWRTLVATLQGLTRPQRNGRPARV